MDSHATDVDQHVVNTPSQRRIACFVPNCEHHDSNVASIRWVAYLSLLNYALMTCRRHSRSVHKIDYCHGCCFFFKVKHTYCPQCHRYCMSPTCSARDPAISDGTALRQRHLRGPRCPKVRGTSTGVSTADTLSYLTRLCKRSQMVRDEHHMLTSCSRSGNTA